MEPESFVKVSKALADPQRFAILERIAREPGELEIQRAIEAGVRPQSQAPSEVTADTTGSTG